jgi:hypothetical protein
MSGVARSLGEYAADPTPIELAASGKRRDRASDDATHRMVVAYFEEAENSAPMRDMREWADRDRQYRGGTQWTQAEIDALRARGQPVITVNKIGDKVDLLCGLERKARTDPKAFPNTPNEDERADAATQALRYICNDNDFQECRSAVYEEMLVEGYGVDLALADDGQGGADITITHVPWDRLFYDPHSRRQDFSDARYLGMVIWMDRDELYDLYPDADDVIEEAFSEQTYADTFADRPRDGVGWIDSQRIRIRVVQIQWHDKGKWQRVTFTKCGILDKIVDSPFKDKRGDSCSSLILQSAYVDRENRRFGMVRDLISIQDEINKRRSKALHLLSVNRIITEQGAVEDFDEAKKQMARPDGAIAVLPGMRFELHPGGDLAAGQFQLLQHATQEMQLAGPNAAMSGTDERELSGRAILAQQAGGAVQNEPLADALRMWARRVYESCWMAAREYWTGPRWVRVTDDLGSTRWVGINQPVTVQDKLAAMPEQQRAMVMQQMQLQPGDPRLQQVVETNGQIDDLNVDIAVEEGIDIPSIQAEQFQTLVQLAGMQPGLIPPEVLIAASGLKNKDMLLQHDQTEAAAGGRAATEDAAGHRGARASRPGTEAGQGERRLRVGERAQRRRWSMACMMSMPAGMRCRRRLMHLRIWAPLCRPRCKPRCTMRRSATPMPRPRCRKPSATICCTRRPAHDHCPPGSAEAGVAGGEAAAGRAAGAAAACAAGRACKAGRRRAAAITTTRLAKHG